MHERVQDRFAFSTIAALIALVVAVLALAACAAPVTLASTQTSSNPTLPTSPTAAPTSSPTAAPTPSPTAPPTATAPAANSSSAQATKAAASTMPAPPWHTYQVVQVLPHDIHAFTQGLVYTDGVFYEGTGLKGRSSLRKVDPATGQVQQQQQLSDEYFGEGVAVLGDKIYQLTWKNGAGFVYDRNTFAELGRFTYLTEGWGITHDGAQLIVSDGTPNLYFWDPTTLQETGRITVTYQSQLVPQLNELEYIDGEIFANVWQTNYIVRIDPATGNVTGVINLDGLLDYAPPLVAPVDVLNGIAYDVEQDRLFVTGKFWPAVFEIELVQVLQP